MRERQQWVVDTNVLISRLLVPSGVAARAFDTALGEGVLLMSEATLGELVATLNRPKFDAYLNHDERRRFIALLGGIARLVHVAHRVHACRDPKDDKFLDVALAGGARAIITGDADLLALDPFHGVRVVTPAGFLAGAVADRDS